MIIKNLERIQRMLVQLDAILDTDDSVSNTDKRWIHEAVIRLQRVNGVNKETEAEHLRVLGYDSKAS